MRAKTKATGKRNRKHNKFGLLYLAHSQYLANIQRFGGAFENIFISE